MAFPEEEDIRVQQHAKQLRDGAVRLSDWAGKFASMREGRAAISKDEHLELLQLRRSARSYWASSRVPVAAAVYGPSQVGKSLFVGRVLKPCAAGKTALGREACAETPSQLSFEKDLNPGLVGEFEATALVTRFTTKERIGEVLDRDCPVLVRALTRRQWLSVLARGFEIECGRSHDPWNDRSLENELIQLSGKGYQSAEDDPSWRGDLLETYEYIRGVNSLHYLVKDQAFNSLLGRYTLSPEGYSALAAKLFWEGDRFPKLTEIFAEVCGFLDQIGPRRGRTVEVPATDDSEDAFIMADWRSVRFLLDCQRRPSYDTETFGHERIEWDDFLLEERPGFNAPALSYTKGQGANRHRLHVVQAAMSEMVVPVLPENMSEDWRQVLVRADLLDLPGMRVGRAGGPKESKRPSVNDLQDQMAIIKRGKVAYLFERYSDERQIQTLLLLVRGGNTEAPGLIQAHVDRWGKSRYGYGNDWYKSVRDDPPPLLLGMTGFDEEFKDRQGFADEELYKSRIEELRNALGPLMDNFGGKNRVFTNLYLIRYPGTWDKTESEQESIGVEKWNRARQAFSDSDMVKKYVAAVGQKVEAAMHDEDGGLSLVSDNIRKCTTAAGKRALLERAVRQLAHRGQEIGRRWLVTDDVNERRKKRQELAERVLHWLTESPRLTHYRVHAIKESFTVSDMDVFRVADLPDMASPRPIIRDESLEMRVRAELHSFLGTWASVVPKRWARFIHKEEEQLARARTGETQKIEDYLNPAVLEKNDIADLAVDLREYLCSQPVFEGLCRRILDVLKVRHTDRAALESARRSYVQLILNDYLLNPGPPVARLAESDLPDDGDFGLVARFVGHWRSRLPGALADGAGQHVVIPPGNAELKEICEHFEALVRDLEN